MPDSMLLRSTAGSRLLMLLVAALILVATTVTSLSAAPTTVKRKPKTLTFKGQVVGTTSPAKAVSITNSGTVPLSIQSISIQGDFIQTSACAGALATSASCSVLVAISPTVLGHRSGSLTITDDAPDSPQIVKLSGNGKKPKNTKVKFDPLPGTDSGALIPVSPLGEGTVDTKKSKATLQTATNVPQMVALMDTTRNFGWTAVSPSWFTDQKGSFGSLSTAVQLVFMVPGVFSDSLSAQTSIISLLVNLSAVQSFAAALQGNAAAADPLSLPAVQSAYQAAVTAGLQAVSTLPPPSAKRTELTIVVTKSTIPSSRVTADTGSVSFDGPNPLNDADALFAVTSATASGVTVQPVWGPSPVGGLFLQGLYWIAAMYPVGASAYASFNDLTQFWNQGPWQTDIGLHVQVGQPSIAILPPQTSFFDLLNINSLIANVVGSLVSGSPSPTDGGTFLSANSVYALHLYTCGFALSNPSNFAPDESLIAGWDSSEASGLYMGACAFNVAMISLDGIDTLLGADAFKSAFDGSNSSCSATFKGALGSMLASAAHDFAPFAAQGQPPADSAVLAVLGNESLAGLKALIPVAECGVTSQGLLSFLGFLGDAFKNLLNPYSKFAAIGNLVNTVGTAIDVEPWQGEYIEVGDPWAVPPPSSTFSTTGSMLVPRIEHTATLLQDGTVLVSGGLNNTSVVSSAEIYNPSAGTFTLTAGGMTKNRDVHTGTLLPSGQVLIAGGFDNSTPNQCCFLNSAELYNPSIATFSATAGQMTSPRGFDTATLLNNGKVLLAGGVTTTTSGCGSNTSDLYDPNSETFSATKGRMMIPRMGATAMLLQSGEVLIAGGLDDFCQPLRSAELYNPNTDSFSSTAGGMLDLRDCLSGPLAITQPATLLQTGRVLFEGGCTPGDATAEIYDALSVGFAATGNMNLARSAPAASLLQSGKVLVSGGFVFGTGTLSSAEVYDPGTGAFSFTSGNMTGVRTLHTSTTLNNGQVLIAGGEQLKGDFSSFTVLQSAELYNP